MPRQVYSGEIQRGSLHIQSSQRNGEQELKEKKWCVIVEMMDIVYLVMNKSQRT